MEFGDGSFPWIEYTDEEVGCYLDFYARLVSPDQDGDPAHNIDNDRATIELKGYSSDSSMTLHSPAAGDGSVTVSWDPFLLGFTSGDRDSVHLVWKSGGEDYDHSRRVQIDHKHPRTYTIDDLTNGATYSFKLVVNQANEEYGI